MSPSLIPTSTVLNTQPVLFRSKSPLAPSAANVSLSDVAQGKVGPQQPASQNFGAPGSAAGAFGSPKPPSAFNSASQSAFVGAQSSPGSFNSPADFSSSLPDFKDLSSSQSAPFSDNQVAAPVSPFSQQQRSAVFSGQSASVFNTVPPVAAPQPPQTASFAAPSSSLVAAQQPSSSMQYTTASGHPGDSLEAPVSYASNFRSSMDLPNPDSIAEFRPSGNLFPKPDVDFNPASSAFATHHAHPSSYYSASRTVGSSFEQAPRSVADAQTVAGVYGAAGADRGVSTVFGASDYSSMVGDAANKSAMGLEFPNSNLVMDPLARSRAALQTDMNFSADPQQQLAASAVDTKLASNGKPKLSNVCEVSATIYCNVVGKW